MNTIPDIRFAWLVPSYACNKRCAFCYNGPDLLEDKSKATEAQADRMVEALAGLSVEHCTVLGGEPLIYPHLERLVDALFRRGTKVSLVTNGLQFARQPQRTAWLQTVGVDSIMVSLEPAPPKIGPRRTGGKRALRMIAGDHAAQDTHEVLRALDGLPELPIKYVIKLFRDTVHSVPELVDRVATTSHRRVLFSFGTAVMAPGAPAITLLNPRELAAWYEHLEAYARARGVLATFYMNLPLCTFSKAFLERVIPEARGTFGCSLLRGDSIVLDHYGRVTQCTHFMPLAADNIFAGPETTAEKIRQVWSSGDAAATRDALAVARHPACLSCVCFQRNCWGGCPILWSHFDPDDFISSGTASGTAV